MLSVLAIAMTAYIDWRAFRTATRRAEQTRQILVTAERVLSAVKDAETGQRGYLLTGDAHDLDPYNSAREALPHLLDSLSSAVASKPTQADKALRLRSLIAAKFVEMAQTLHVRRDEGANAALAIFKTNKGQDVMDKVRSLCAEINTDEYADFVEHSRQA